MWIIYCLCVKGKSKHQKLITCDCSFSVSEINKKHERSFKRLSEVVKFLSTSLNKWKGTVDPQQMKDKTQVILNISYPDKISLWTTLSEDVMGPKFNNHMKCDWQTVNYNSTQTSIPKAIFLI